MGLLERAIAAHKRKGTSVHFIRGLNITKKEKSDLLIATVFAVKGKAPKQNPFFVAEAPAKKKAVKNEKK